MFIMRLQGQLDGRHAYRSISLTRSINAFRRDNRCRGWKIRKVQVVSGISIMQKEFEITVIFKIEPGSTL